MNQHHHFAADLIAGAVPTLSAQHTWTELGFKPADSDAVVRGQS